MTDVRCTQCNKLLIRKFIGRYAEVKCPRCGAINILDYDKVGDLTSVLGGASLKEDKNAQSVRLETL